MTQKTDIIVHIFWLVKLNKRFSKLQNSYSLNRESGCNGLILFDVIIYWLQNSQMSTKKVEDFFKNKVTIRLKTGQQFKGLLSQIDNKNKTLVLQ